MKKVTSTTGKMMVKDDWVVAAVTDDEMVAELLIRLKHAGTVVADNPAVRLPPLRWGIRQRRSRSSRFGVGVNDLASFKKKDVNSARASPNTPLSWSGGSGSGGGSASPSAATADGFEDTSRQASCSTSTGSGSKIFPTNEITSSFSKRLKKKKSSSELKNEENLKLKERVDNKKELASLRSTFDEHNVRNQRLKRIKLDLNSGHVKNETPVNLIHKPQHDRLPESKSCNADVKNSNSEIQGSFFFIPDLNMVPSEEDILYGTS